MFQTKADFDRHRNSVIATVQAQMAENELYSNLITMARMDKYKAELKFLADMPYEQGHEWVRKCFSEFMDLHEADPEKFPMCTSIEVIRLMRAYRKEKNKAAKEAARKRKENAQ